MLDIGCGNGMFLTGANNAGASVVGFDYSMGMARSARQATGAPVGQADAHALPLADRSIDTVLALWMLYHVTDKPAALSEFARVLVDGGQLAAATNSGLPDGLDRLILEALEEVLAKSVDRWHAPLDFTAENGASIVGQVFDSVETHPFLTRFDVTDAETLVRYVGSMLGPIGEEHGDVSGPQLLEAVGRRCEAEISSQGAVSIHRAGAVFLAR